MEKKGVNMKKYNVSPILKWVGGKRQLLDIIKENLPENYNRYFEPFFGGGAVLFDIQPSRAIISDINEELIITYKTIKHDVEDLIQELKKHKGNNSEDYFYEIRTKDRNTDEYKEMTDVEKSARMIYLNKTCYNGLHRVNSLGYFNTPFGNYKNPNIVNETMLKKVSQYFQESVIDIINEDFEVVLKKAKKGDFVYFDPPYDPISPTSSFTEYNQNGFSQKDQLRLRDLCDEINKKGVYFLLSNSATDNIKSLYNKYIIIPVKAKRSVNSKGNGRGYVDEVLIKNF